MGKPKLVKLPESNVNITTEGVLIKVNDRLFVLVENESTPKKYPIYELGDKVIVNGKVEPLLQMEDFPEITITSWTGYVWEDMVTGIEGLYRIGWDANTVFDMMPENFKKLCAERNLEPDDIILPEEFLTLSPDK